MTSPNCTRVLYGNNDVWSRKIFLMALSQTSLRCDKRRMLLLRLLVTVSITIPTASTGTNINLRHFAWMIGRLFYENNMILTHQFLCSVWLKCSMFITHTCCCFFTIASKLVNDVSGYCIMNRNSLHCFLCTATQPPPDE
jgi:hypothetical protein